MDIKLDDVFYHQAPTHRLSLDEFQTLGLARMKLLQQVEMISWSELENAYHPEIEFSLEEDHQRVDHFSHFILRLAFCLDNQRHEEDLQRQLTSWWIRNEVKLLRNRLYWILKEHYLTIDDVLLQLGIPYHHVETKADDIMSSYQFSFDVLPPTMISKRRVILVSGTASIEKMSQVSDVVVYHYELQLRSRLESLRRATKVQSPERHVMDILGHFTDQIQIQILSSRRDSDRVPKHPLLSIDQVDRVAPVRFPLCMSILHRRLREDRHLKYQGRMQYRLFLKELGLSVEDSLAFWRQAFSPKTNAHEFDKRYAYNVRYSYGLEGCRKVQTSSSCSQILNMSKPKVGECHGCPYQTYAPEYLVEELQASRVQEVGPILEHVKGKRYQQACTTHFQMLHPNPPPPLKKLHQDRGQNSTLHRPEIYFAWSSLFYRQ